MIKLLERVAVEALADGNKTLLLQRSIDSLFGSRKTPGPSSISVVAGTGRADIVISACFNEGEAPK